ncbi:MAG: opioid growth factor receptor-related protein [Candidatus Sulfotelmatobacter sp.]
MARGVPAAVRLDMAVRQRHSRTKTPLLKLSCLHCHDYVQWLFPLPEPSGFNLAAPVLNRESIQAFRARPDLQEKLRVSFLRMMNFYGLEARSASKSRSIALRILQPKRPSGSLRAITIIYASQES